MSVSSRSDDSTKIRSDSVATLTTASASLDTATSSSPSLALIWTVTCFLAATVVVPVAACAVTVTSSAASSLMSPLSSTATSINAVVAPSRPARITATTASSPGTNSAPLVVVSPAVNAQFRSVDVTASSTRFPAPAPSKGSSCGASRDDRGWRSIFLLPPVHASGSLAGSLPE